MPTEPPPSFEVFRGEKPPADRVSPPPFVAAPPWRTFTDKSKAERGTQHVVGAAERRAVNAAICLRRPLLVTGRPGTGKSSLARAITEELKLGEVLEWPITSRSTLQQGLYEYDGIARLQETARWEKLGQQQAAQEKLRIEEFLNLGPLGSALADSTPERPRVILVDEIDKSDIDLTNDLLHVFEEGEFTIPELVRLAALERRTTVEIPLYREKGTATATMGKIRCRAFPIVILTSNGEREFPPAFLRRCLRLDIPKPTRTQLEDIVRRRLTIDPTTPQAIAVLDLFEKIRDTEKREIATDQLLNAVHLVCSGKGPADEPFLREIILRSLTESAG